MDKIANEVLLAAFLDELTKNAGVLDTIRQKAAPALLAASTMLGGSGLGHVAPTVPGSSSGVMRAVRGAADSAATAAHRLPLNMHGSEYAQALKQYGAFKVPESVKQSLTPVPRGIY